MTNLHLITQTRALKCSCHSMSSHSSDTSRAGDSTTFLSSPFSCLTPPSTKKFLLSSNLNFPWQSLRLFSLVLSLVPWQQSVTQPLAAPSRQGIVESQRVPPGLLCSRLRPPQLLLVLQTLPLLHSLLWTAPLATRAPDLSPGRVEVTSTAGGGPAVSEQGTGLWPHQCWDSPGAISFLSTWVPVQLLSPAHPGPFPVFQPLFP